jgi:SAM-dependent methyltransferase
VTNFPEARCDHSEQAAAVWSLGSGMRLMRRNLLVKTGPVDFAEWNSRPLLGWISRQRFRLVVSLLPKAPIVRLLEIGYGSGIFLPELARYSRQVFGLDVHAESERVAQGLAKMDVQAQLHRASAAGMPFADGHFDVVVSVSCLEFISDLSAAVGEIARVLAPRGAFIVVIPNQSKIADAGLWMLTVRKAEVDFKGQRQQVIPTLMQHFEVDYCLTWPHLKLVQLYTAFRFKRKELLSCQHVGARVQRESFINSADALAISERPNKEPLPISGLALGERRQHLRTRHR